jgi:hypothetical protein
MQALQELPEEFPYNQDMNSGNPLGVGAGMDFLLIISPTH